VDEISAAGGQATAAPGDVSSWSTAQSLVETAISHYGQLDILVNNAGVLRDRTIFNISEQEWDTVIAVHLKGHAAVLHHAAAYWKAQSKSGQPVRASVINTASASGTFLPNPGQANYGAAKAGIAALTQVAAAELGRYGVRVNAIAPVARTRLTLATPGMGAMFAAEVPEGQFDMFSPENISPLVAYLAGDECSISGTVFAVQGGSISKVTPMQLGETIETDGPWELDDLHKRLTNWS
jgi:NAD(P)-dependent dehydrogenase (short-subunit alcohol dehydrogenase family)